MPTHDIIYNRIVNDNRTSYFEDHPVPRIICSKGLV